MSKVMGWLVLGVMVAACSKDPVNRTENGTLAAGDPQHPKDQSFYDEYTFEAQEGWQVRVDMTSTAFDTFLQVRRADIPDEEFLQQHDDMVAGSNTNSQISFVAPASGVYKVWANSASAGETGAYSVTIHAAPAGQ